MKLHKLATLVLTLAGTGAVYGQNLELLSGNVPFSFMVGEPAGPRVNPGLVFHPPRRGSSGRSPLEAESAASASFQDGPIPRTGTRPSLSLAQRRQTSVIIREPSGTGFSL